MHKRAENGVETIFYPGTAALPNRLNAALEQVIPEKRIFLKTESATRVIHLRPMAQLGLIGGTALLIGWTIISGAVLAYDRIGGAQENDAHSTKAAYETRLNALAKERDARATEAQEAQLRFAVALDQVAKYQNELLSTQKENRELAAGLDAVQQKLGTAMAAMPHEHHADMSSRLSSANPYFHTCK